MNNNSAFPQLKNFRNLLILAGIIIVFFVLARLFLRVLYAVAPILIIATAIINYKVIVNYASAIGKSFKRNPFLGVAAGALSIFFYPIVTAFLFVQALMGRKLEKMQQAETRAQDGEYIDYEEVKHEVEPEDLLEELNKRRNIEREDNNYWDLLNDDKKR
jgi:hypothetical protein